MNNKKNDSRVLSLIDNMYALIVTRKEVFSEEELLKINSEITNIKSDYFHLLFTELDNLVRDSAKKEFSSSNSLLSAGDNE